MANDDIIIEVRIDRRLLRIRVALAYALHRLGLERAAVWVVMWRVECDKEPHKGSVRSSHGKDELT